MGEMFGKYALIERIGVGGMAEVFKAEVHGPEGFVRPVVIKHILPGLTEDPEFEAMFVREARIAVKLRHANIVQVFNFDEIDGQHYIAMQWVDGADLERICEAARARAMQVPVNLVVHVGVEALKGLHYAHTRKEGGQELGIIHRDISPQNLLVSFSGEARITDFGIAKMAALASSTRPGMLKGKLAYMSPEQLRGDPLDARSDLYSLGIVLWEALAGQHAHASCANEGELMAAVRRAEVPRLGQRRTDLPQGLDAVIHHMLARSPEDRFDSAAEALSALGVFGSVGDELAVAAFMRRVLPAQAERQAKGLTEPVARDKRSVSGPPAIWDAPTQARAVDDPAQQAAEQDDPPRARSPVDPAQESLGPSGIGSLEIAAFALGLAGLVAGAIWLHHLLADRGYASGAGRALASVAVRTEPAGASLSINGVKVDTRPPLTVSSTRGMRLRLRATDSVTAIEQQVVVNADAPKLVMLQVPEATRPSTAPRPAAAKPPATPARAEPKAAPRPAPEKGARSSTHPDRRVRKRRTGPRRSRRAAAGAVSPATAARLTVVVRPWARVRVDGRLVGITPISGVKIAPGHRRVTIENAQLGQKETVRMFVNPRANVVIRRNWRATE